MMAKKEESQLEIGLTDMFNLIKEKKARFVPGEKAFFYAGKFYRRHEKMPKFVITTCKTNYADNQNEEKNFR